MAIIWKDINGWKGYYKISSRGAVKSLARIVRIDYVTHLGNSFTRISHFKAQLLNTNPDKNGYLCVSLRVIPKMKTVKIHRLIADAFIPKISNKRLINHKNGNIRDNRIENLEWVNARENVSHRFLNSKNKNSRFTGVYKHKKKWVAQIQINGEPKYLGYFEKESDAAKAYEKALKENKLENKYKKK